MVNYRLAVLCKCCLCAVLVSSMPKCSWSLGPTTMVAWSEPTSYHTGFTAQAMAAIPRTYRYTLGLETSTLFQTSPTIASDQWRFGFVGGYASSPQPYERWGFELLVRAQYMRGAEGSFNPNGGVFGASVAFPWRGSASRDPWQVEEVAGLRQYIVPAIGINAVIGRSQTIHPEIFFSLSFRFAATSPLLP